jgi:Ca2+-binding RTX toxin-like protein
LAISYAKIANRVLDEERVMAEVSVGGGATGGVYKTALTHREANLATRLLQSFTTSEVQYENGRGSRFTLTGPDKVLILGNNHPFANDTLISNTKGAVLVGNQGNDKFILMAHGDVVGGNGNDTVTLMAGGDVYLGNGNDKVNVSGSGKIHLGSGNDTVSLGFGNDTITAKGSTTVHGGGGMHAVIDNGTLSQSGTSFGFESVSAIGNVTVHGAAHEWLEGSNGAVLFAHAGGDTLQGGAGDAVLHGNSGRDLFVFNLRGTGLFADTVTGFGAHDKIELAGVNIHALLSNSTTTGNYVSYNGSVATIHLGNGSTITLEGVHGHLTTSDFVGGHH